MWLSSFTCSLKAECVEGFWKIFSIFLATFGYLATFLVEMKGFRKFPCQFSRSNKKRGARLCSRTFSYIVNFSRQGPLKLVFDCKVKGNCPWMGPDHTGGLSSMEVILKDHSHIYANFGENHGKLRTAK